MRFAKILFPALTVATTLSIAAPAAAECFVNWSWVAQSECGENRDRGTMIPSGRGYMDEMPFEGDGEGDEMGDWGPNQPMSPTSPPTTPPTSPETPPEMS